MFAFQVVNHLIREGRRNRKRGEEDNDSYYNDNYQKNNKKGKKRKKYELLKHDTITVSGVELYRIRALITFGNVKKGDLGGYIQSEGNLRNIFESDDEDFSWVYDNAKVYGNARVYFDSYT